MIVRIFTGSPQILQKKSSHYLQVLDAIMGTCSQFRRLKQAEASACNTDTTQTQPHQIPNTQRTENKTTNVVTQQHSRNLLKMDILMPETC